MWTLTSSALLASILVTGLSLPRPDDEAYGIPSVGVGGPRNQYYVLHKDGTFKYGYDTVDDAFESTKRHSNDRQEGFFGYRDPESGQQIRLEYESGTGGFVAKGDHIPKPSAAYNEAFASARSRSGDRFVDPLASGNIDRSYDFGFSSDDHSRSETSNSDGTVSGRYSYVDETGVKRNFRYRAGTGIGFEIVPEGSTRVDAPRPPTQRRQQIQRQSVVRQQSSQTQRRPAGNQQNQHSQLRTNYQSGGQVETKTSQDGSYSFHYTADDHERRESADKDLNVEGSFSFVADDGQRRTLNYKAGSETGFEAEGDHLPVAPEAPTFGVRIPSTRRQPTQTVRKATQPVHKQKTGYFTPSVRSPSVSSHSTRTPSVHTSVPSLKTSQFEEANIESEITPAGPYFFKYETSSHSRSESGDDDNDVDGEFSFIADDGVRREVKYEAGSDTGFIAEGDHIPVGPIVPGAPSGRPTGRLVRLRSEPFVDPLASGDSDASYNFEFESDYYSRSEKADEDGNVEGTYTMVDEDGNKITYKFRAGKGIGFVTEEISRSKVDPPKKNIVIPQTTFQIPQTNNFNFKAPTSRLTPSIPQYKTPSANRVAQITPSRRTTFQGDLSPTPPRRTTFRGDFSPKKRLDVFPGFTLNQYDAEEDADKFGYVLRFDN